LLAGGATLEDVATETALELGRIDWTPQSDEGPAAYEGFRAAAAAVTEDDFPAMAFLEDGSIFALRLDEVLPPRPEPFEDARERALMGWTQDATEDALRLQAEAAVTALQNDPDFSTAGLAPRIENGLTRTAFIEGTGPGFMEAVFEMEPGEIRVLAEGGQVQIVRLDRIAPPAESPELVQLRERFASELDGALAAEIFEVFARDAQSRARPQIDQRALTAVQNSFP
jgi:peptidyl-prolyl cis-trans isomerase D